METYGDAFKQVAAGDPSVIWINADGIIRIESKPCEGYVRLDASAVAYVETYMGGDPYEPEPMLSVYPVMPPLPAIAREFPAAKIIQAIQDVVTTWIAIYDTYTGSHAPEDLQLSLKSMQKGRGILLNSPYLELLYNPVSWYVYK